MRNFWVNLFLVIHFIISFGIILAGAQFVVLPIVLGLTIPGLGWSFIPLFMTPLVLLGWQVIDIGIAYGFRGESLKTYGKNKTPQYLKHRSRFWLFNFTCYVILIIVQFLLLIFNARAKYFLIIGIVIALGFSVWCYFVWRKILKQLKNNQ